ncbi:hypothetical protein L798_08771 [Zootermopsis nevadensis]|uniref:Uncharacterized protein n=2 Tax=Zootermopsis nevadensis TaxID=136037 RepID=A0A067R4G6_ZOONE|nr:hypothetical protein L798_08771 [Zootermopsis nevadensis]
MMLPYILQCNICLSHEPIQHAVLLLGATPRIQHPDVYTPGGSVDQRWEDWHKNVSSGRLVHYVILFYYGSSATASYPPHAKCKILHAPCRPEVGLNSSFFSCSILPLLSQMSLYDFNSLG